MTFVTMTVLATVNAPYGTSLSAEQLTSKIVDPASAEYYEASAFAFFSEVCESLQHSFLDEMHVNLTDAFVVAQRFSDMAGYELPLARAA